MEERIHRSQTIVTDALSRCACGNFARPGEQLCNACTRALSAEASAGRDASVAGTTTSGGDHVASSATMDWTWVAQHELPRWGEHSDDLAAIGQPERLTYPTLVTPELACTQCDSRLHVQLLRHHPGDCGAFEWTHGIDIDWRWTCCGEHEDFANIDTEYKCSPRGAHSSGCVVAPLCTACFRCPCAVQVSRRRMQEQDMAQY